MLQQRIRSRDYAIGRFYRSAYKWDFAEQRLRHSPWKTCIRTAVSTACASFARVAGAMHVPIHPNVAQRIRGYLEATGHAGDLDGPMFRPLSHNRKNQEMRRHMAPDAIDRVLRKHAASIGLTRGYSAHSMRATFITTALENGATLDDVQRAAGHSEPSTTKLYDRRGYNPAKSASFFATY